METSKCFIFLNRLSVLFKLKASDDGWNDEMIKRGSIPMMLLYGIAIICTLLHLSLLYFGFDVGSGGRFFFFKQNYNHKNRH